MVVPAVGVAVRLSSVVVPAFGGTLSRLHLEPIGRYRRESLGSFFEPSRTGTVYELTADRAAGAVRPPARPEWRYEGAELGSRLGSPRRVQLLRERVRGADFAWQADRGLVLTGAGGDEGLVLSVPEQSEVALFVSSLGLYRSLVDPATAPAPGVTARDLLGYGDWAGDLEIGVDLLPVRTMMADR